MSIENITTKSIKENLVAQFQAALNQTIPLLPKAFLRVLADALAGVVVLLYKYCGFIFLQLFVSRATINPTVINGLQVRPLIEWGRLIGVGDPTAATFADLQIAIAVNTQTGSIPAGSLLLGITNGVTYSTTSSVALDAATVFVNVLAVADQSDGGGAGVLGNLDIGAELSFANPLGNINRTALVSLVNVTAADEEAEAVYRQRVLDRFQKRPQGGAPADYELWSEEVAGIINAYPYTSSCPGQVEVYVEATEASSGSPDGIPTAAQLQAVQDSIQFNVSGIATRRPVGALVNTLSIIRTGFDVTINGLAVADQAQVENDIQTALIEYFLQRDPFISGLSILPRRDRVTRSAVGGIIEDIVSAAGGVYSSAIVKESASDVFIYTLEEGEKAKLASLTVV